MNAEQMNSLLLYRIEQAHESLREATILHTAKAQRSAFNRAYYAMFYALLALLATKQLGTSKHSGAISLFDREFVKTGLFPLPLSKSLHLAFERRQVHDYGEMIELDFAMVDETITDANAFVDAVEGYPREQCLLG